MHIQEHAKWAFSYMLLAFGVHTGVSLPIPAHVFTVHALKTDYKS